MTTFAIDFETYYDKEVSISTLGIYHYLRHPQSSIYMVGIYSGTGGLAYVGPPADAPWEKLRGAHLVAHNARFDKACFDRLIELGSIPADLGVTWDCTADMVSFLGCPRSLKEAVATLFGVSLSKDMRDNMKGVTYEKAVQKGMAEELAVYCLKDARWCYKLWDFYAHRWPEEERRLSRLTREMCDRGIAVNTPLLQEGRRKLGEVACDALDKIPWVPENPPLSPKALRQACAEACIEAPPSLAEDSPECSAWEERYGDAFPWVGAMRDYRKVNALDKKLHTLDNRLQDGGIFAYGLKYFGAHTGRWSGDSGFNMQNLPRTAMYGVELRPMLIPRPGHVFVISDLGQIEQRVLSWLAGDNRMMEVLETGVSVYEAHARATMGYTGTESLKHADPDMYRLAKARVLGLGYGAGAAVFVKIAKAMAGLTISPAQASQVVAEFRRTNPLVLALWKKLEQAFRLRVGKGDFELPLPSGRRSLIYRRVRNLNAGLAAEVQGRPVSLFGGKLTENLTSATARDVLGDILLRLDDAGYQVVMHVHDEVVVEVPRSRIDTALKDVEAAMTTNPDWLQGLPLAAETMTSEHYTK